MCDVLSGVVVHHQNQTLQQDKKPLPDVNIDYRQHVDLSIFSLKISKSLNCFTPIPCAMCVPAFALTHNCPLFYSLPISKQISINRYRSMCRCRNKVIILCLISAVVCASCATLRHNDHKSLMVNYDDAYVTTELFFGLSQPDGGTVTEAEWQHFVDTIITPRFQDGLTVIDAKGQWMERSSGKVIREGSKIVILIHRKNKNTVESINEIKKFYKKMFHQESVLETNGSSDVLF